MNYFKEILVPHEICADPIYCSALDGKQVHHCQYELRAACALFKTALEDQNFTNMKCRECLDAMKEGEA